MSTRSVRQSRGGWFLTTHFLVMRKFRGLVFYSDFSSVQHIGMARATRLVRKLGNQYVSILCPQVLY